MSKRPNVLWVVALLCLASGRAFAIDPNAQHIDVRVSCPEPPGNCVTSMGEVNTWLANVRADDAPPVIIDVGPGTFGPFKCNGDMDRTTLQDSAITLRGSGRSVTTISEPHGSRDAVGLSHCTGIEIQHLALRAGRSAITWRGPGTSIYTDIDAGGDDYAWWDISIIEGGGVCPFVSDHWSWSSTWRDTKAPMSSGYVWAGDCSRAFFFDSEIRGFYNAVTISHDAEMELYGSVLRVVADENAALSGDIYGVLSLVTGGRFQMHGGLFAVDLSSSGSPNANAIGANVIPGTLFRTQETAFLLKASGSGTATRILEQGGTAESPFLLAPSANPPTAGPGGGAYVSSDGQDVYVETDCLASGDCDATGNPGATETHLMVYSSSCTTAGPWFDIVTGRCRGDLMP